MDTLLNQLEANPSVRKAIAYADDLAVIIEDNSRLDIEAKAAAMFQYWKSGVLTSK